MTTVRAAAYDLLRRHGITTMFGNPGSTELPMLADFPQDFRYILALQEAVAVGMADGYAQASGTVGHVNLHTAPGVGNAMGALFNAQANRTPLLVTAGQQVRAQITMQANLTNADATQVPHPFVKWSFEPPRAQDVPAALARAIHHAALAPSGPAFVSVPMDDWAAEADDGAVARLLARDLASRAGAEPEVVRALARRLEEASAPCLVAGPGIDAAGAWDTAVALAEKLRLPVFASPATGGGRLGFPEDHPSFQGVLPPALGPLGATLEPYDLVLCAGTSVFPYYPYIPGPALADETRLVAITNDPSEAARAPMGDAVVADVRLTLEALLAEVRETSGRPQPSPMGPLPALDDSTPLSSARVCATLADVLPDDAIVVLEAPTATAALRARLRIGRSASYWFGAGGGLGFGLSAALGVQLALPERRVVCVLGEGSAQYAITAFWTAAAYAIPVTFVILRNDEYGILKWFAALESVSAVPGLDLPALDVRATAASYGVPGTHANGGAEDLRTQLLDALATAGPSLVEVPVAPGISL
ncbi:benzoylformate decarboxylase [Amycolatopsis pithecellobii]|uniref:Benzoylformate decarboxylase n=1 Tax=Amycolatopsis pithecellobii TaxID=664692 RepID=A0A6N7Z9V2_9PSEU|nr:benzoylformate decarboxylase [Amycolatopsis pithecellobii]MTD58515.1 benzoylformate decarboxylase [Amycolatopsis pithecellobii]